ncbi:MAG TPA: MarR family transcriptional regulator [Bacteroidales bacterium]|nr:MarR family transcriptional regulator [Bacteroidales bacterium]
MSAEKVLETMKKVGKPMKSAEIATATGIDKAEVDKIIKKLKQEDKVFSPKVCFYQAK